MKRIAAVALATALFAAAAPRSAAAAELPKWFDAKASDQTNALAALHAKDSAGNAAGTLVRMGSDAPGAVRAVVEVYNNCPALYEAVREGAKAAPAKAGQIAASVAKLSNCPCSGENVWARSRLENRLRTSRPAVESLSLGTMCTCTAATAEAAALAVPEQADAILRALLAVGGNAGCDCAATAFASIANGLGADSKRFIEEERQKAERADTAAAGPQIVDVLGQVSPGKDKQVIQAEGRAWLRKADDCVADSDPYDAFKGGRVFDQNALGATYTPRCSKPPKSILISRYLEMADGSRAAEIYNGTDQPVDLGAAGLRLEVYGGNKGDPAHVVPLTGVIAPGGRYLVATPDASAALRDAAQIVTPDVAVAQADAVLLRRLGDDTGLACPAEIAGLATQYPQGPIPLAPPVVATADGEPRSDDSVVDPNRGGELASPN